MNQTCVGIEIGGTKLQIVAGHPNGAIAHRWRFQIEPAQGGEGIRQQIARALPDIIKQTQPAALGVGFGGPVDGMTGRICCSHQIEGWSEFPLGEWLHAQTRLPARIDNDANVAALGEAKRGAGRGANPVAYVTLGSGVGGGLVVDGQIYHGAHPGEMEIGHLRLDREGTIVEDRCSGWAVDRRIREAIRVSPGGALSRLAAGAERGEARFLSAALAENDPLAREILRDVATDLAFALSHVTHLVHPEVLVIGGGLALLGEPLREAVAQALPGFVMEAFWPVPSVRLAALREDSVPVGALTLAGTVLQ